MGCLFYLWRGPLSRDKDGETGQRPVWVQLGISGTSFITKAYKLNSFELKSVHIRKIIKFLNDIFLGPLLSA